MSRSDDFSTSGVSNRDLLGTLIVVGEIDRVALVDILPSGVLSPPRDFVSCPSSFWTVRSLTGFSDFCDRRLFAAGRYSPSSPPMMQVYDLDSSESLLDAAEIQNSHTSTVYGLTRIPRFSPDDDDVLFATGSRSGKVCLWRIDCHQRTQPSRESRRPIFHSYKLLPMGVIYTMTAQPQSLFVAGLRRDERGGLLEEHDLENEGLVVRTFGGPGGSGHNSREVFAVVAGYGDEIQTVVSGGWDAKCCLWDRRSCNGGKSQRDPQQVVSFPSDRRVFSLYFAQDRESVLVGFAHGDIAICDRRKFSGEPLVANFSPHKNSYVYDIWRVQEDLYASVSFEGSVALWNTRNTVPKLVSKTRVHATSGPYGMCLMGGIDEFSVVNELSGGGRSAEWEARLAFCCEIVFGFGCLCRICVVGGSDQISVPGSSLLVQLQ